MEENKADKQSEVQKEIEGKVQEVILAKHSQEAVQQETIVSEPVTITPPVQRHLAQELMHKIRLEVGKVIVGQTELIELLVIALFTEGHVLIEGVPGIAKTTTAKLFARSISSAFSRIQFTPDLMPTDVTGTSVFNLKTSEFEFKKGPIFSNLVLIDEINRAPAKTQAALFEVMEEKQLSMDGTTYPFESPFMVLATQNPIEQEGTYKLPEAQLDRFVFKAKLEYPDLHEELEILHKFSSDFSMKAASEVKAVVSSNEIAQAQQEIEQVHISKELMKYIAQLIQETRNNSDLFLGASPRASLAILKTSKAMAAINGKNFVTPEDIQKVIKPILNHRIMLAPDKEIEGYETEDVINDIIKKVEVPR